MDLRYRSTLSFSNWQRSLMYSLCMSGVTEMPDRSRRSVTPEEEACLINGAAALLAAEEEEEDEAAATADGDDDNDDDEPRPKLAFISCCR